MTFVFLAFLIPLRQDFAWLLNQVFPYLIYVILVLGMQPDSKIDMLMNLAILTAMYFQCASVFIASVYVLNYKVFHFGYKRVKHVKHERNDSL